MSEHKERDPASIWTPPAARGDLLRGERLKGLRIAVVGAGQMPSDEAEPEPTDDDKDAGSSTSDAPPQLKKKGEEPAPAATPKP